MAYCPTRALSYSLIHRHVIIGRTMRPGPRHTFAGGAQRGLGRLAVVSWFAEKASLQRTNVESEPGDRLVLHSTDHRFFASSIQKVLRMNQFLGLFCRGFSRNCEGTGIASTRWPHFVLYMGGKRSTPLRHLPISQPGHVNCCEPPQICVRRDFLGRTRTIQAWIDGLVNAAMHSKGGR